MTANANDTAYDHARLAFVRSLIPPGEGRALDVGCASGETTAVLAALGYSPLGVDTDPAAIEAARSKYPDLQFCVGSIREAATDGPFAVVMCLEVIEHIERAEQEDFVRELRCSLLPGGVLVMSTPGRWSMYSLYERFRWILRNKRGYDWWDPTHVGIISARRLFALVRHAGLTVMSTGGFHFVPQRMAKPFGLRGPLGRAGFCVVVVGGAT